MKTLYKIMAISLTLVLLASLFVFAVPTAAAPGDTLWLAQTLPSGTSTVIKSGASVGQFAIADANTIYAIDTLGTVGVAPNDTVYKSTNAGQSFSIISTVATPALAPVAIAVAPDNASAIALTDGLDVYVSNDAGTTWSTLPRPVGAGFTVTDIAVGPAQAGTLLGRKYAVSVADNGAGTIVGDVLIIGGTATWASAGGAAITGLFDFMAVRFSPNFIGDRTLVAVGVAAGPPAVFLINTATVGLVRAATPLTVTAPASIDFDLGVTVNSIVSADIALPSDFDPTASGGQRTYVAIASVPAAGVYPNDNDAWRVDAGSARALGALTAQPVRSVAFAGTVSAGKLFMGQANSPTVKYTADPTSTSPTWSSAGKQPNGPATAATFVRTAADFATTTRVFAATSGAAAGQNNGFFISDDGGVSFNGEAFLNQSANSVVAIQDMTLTPDNATIFLATDDGAFLSIWKSSTTTSSTSWSRIFSVAGTTAKITLSPGWATTPALFFADLVASGAIYVSQNGGTTFANRLAPTGVTLTAFAAQDNNILYLGDALGNVYKSTNASFFWGALVAGKAGAIVSMVVPTADNVIVGGTNAVSYSTDGGATFTAIATGLPAATFQVVADSAYATNKTIYAGSSVAAAGTIFRYVIGTSTTWDNLFNPANAALNGVVAMAFGGGPTLYGISAVDADRTLNPTSAPGSVVWRTMNIGAPGGFTLAASTRPTGGNYIWAANGAVPNLFAYRDWLAVTKPSLTGPPDNYQLSVDPVNGRGDTFNISWDIMGTGSGLVNAVDVQVAEKAVGFTGATTFPAVGVTATGPTLSVGPAQLINFTMKANTDYQWRIRASNEVSTDALISQWSDARTIKVQAGAPVQQPYAGPVLLGPAGGQQNVNPSSVGFTWAPMSGATEYSIVIATDAGLTKTVGGTPKLVTVPSFQVTGLANGTTYFWAIKVTKPSTSAESVGTFTTAPASSPSPTQPQITITQVPTPTIVMPTPVTTQITPAWIYAIIAIGAILIIAVIVLIVRTRRAS